MAKSAVQYLSMPTGEAIAVLAARPEKPAGEKSGIFWLGGFKSVMTGGKASTLAKWAKGQHIASCRFDYSGNGQSDNTPFEAATISGWLNQALAVFDAHTEGPQIVCGSSMGGWLALLLYKALQTRGELERVRALMLIAPAADMTEDLLWREMNDEMRAAIKSEGVWHQPSAYGDGNYPITARLIEDGRNHLILNQSITVDCPVRILHGDADPDVPWQHGLKLFDALDGEDVAFTLIKGGDHRLSTPGDLARLISTIEGLV